jgi:drug/metabolite transporter (DMT)-like permease
MSGGVLAWTALVIVYVVWGSTYLAIRVGVRDLPPGVLAGGRYLIAGLLLFPVALRSGPPDLRARDRPRPAQWAACTAVGLLLLVMGNGGVTVAEQTVPSALAAVLVATVPLWMVVFGIVLRGERITVLVATGLLIGLGGVVVLADGASRGGHLTGILIALGAAAAWALGSVWGHQLPVPQRALLAAAMQMLVAGVVLLAAGAISGEFDHLHWSRVGTTSWLALAWLVVPGSILAFTAYGYALAHLPLATVSTYAYVNPLVAVLLGTMLLNEPFTARTALGTALVVGSVALTIRRRQAPDHPVIAEPDPEPAEAACTRQP